MLASWLFIPGNNEKHVQKAQCIDANAIIFDLEDAVTIHEKRNARQRVVRMLEKGINSQSYVRVNSLETDWFLDDIHEVVLPHLDGVVLPKVNKREDILIADFLIRKMENKRDIHPGTIKLVPLMETAEAILNVYEIARASDRIHTLAFGAEDYMLDVRIQADAKETELLYARSQLVTASRVAQIEAPIDSVYPDLKDKKGLAESIKKGKRFGFGGKLLIHPDQIDSVNRIYAPTTEEIEEAKEIVKVYDASIEKGKGAIQLNGKMIDAPIAARARKVLMNQSGK